MTSEFLLFNYCHSYTWRLRLPPAAREETKRGGAKLLTFRLVFPLKLKRDLFVCVCDLHVVDEDVRLRMFVLIVDWNIDKLQ